MTRSLVVRATGRPILVQDLGRPGLAAIGVTVSGAADRGALRLANRLVGNHEADAALEIVFGGVRLSAQATVSVAVTGAQVAAVHAAGRAWSWGAPVMLSPGEELEIGTAMQGVYVYVGVSGAVASEPVLGSRSRDTLSALGPAPLLVGDVVPLGRSAGAFPVVDVVPRAVVPSTPLPVRVVPGPRLEWFAAGALDRLTARPWRIGTASGRTGVRLERDGNGPHLPRATDRELPSEGMVRGAIQVPPSGSPVVLGPDHPVTGGYPVIAVVVDADLDALSQVPPGREIRFEVV